MKLCRKNNGKERQTEKQNDSNYVDILKEKSKWRTLLRMNSYDSIHPFESVFANSIQMSYLISIFFAATGACNAYALCMISGRWNYSGDEATIIIMIITNEIRMEYVKHVIICFPILK